MKFVQRDLPEQAIAIKKRLQSDVHLKEACKDYECLCARLARGAIDSTEVSQINEILVELRAEIVRRVSRPQRPEERFTQ
ncbi:MAG: hypothetical protein RDA78_04470 [Roseibium sp.]|uniref:hypothetical protein n=1 Tax=Roseibium sp. TaxID=1936156 RepID=UPI003D9C1DDB